MFSKMGGNIFLHREAGIKMEFIPVGTWGLGMHPEMGFYLYPKDDMNVPTVTYGDTDDKSQRIITTFLSRKGKNTGVLLEGTKGSGKTLQAKLLSRQCASIGIPTIIIGSPYAGESFINFLSAIKQPVMVMIDEFDKQYPEKGDQDSMLTLLDGVGGYDKLYVLTKNDGYVSEFLRNRPSRIFYNFSYKKLPKATLDDFLDKCLDNKTFIEDFNTLYELSSDLNFDTVQAITEELNRYPEDKFSDVLTIMGITVSDNGMRVEKKVSKLLINGVDYADKVRHQDMDNMTPARLFSGNTFTIYLPAECNVVNIPGVINAASYDAEEEEWDDSYSYITVKYDEKFVKSMGSSGYVFAGEVEGNTFEIEVVPLEKQSYTDFAFRSY